MNRLTLIGVTALEGAYAARLLHPDSHPQAVIPLLRLVWQYTLNGNTKALADTCCDTTGRGRTPRLAVPTGPA
ncbi:hypothetical protein [Micromonospora sp. WMMD1274]|uniref:hypothetical protein n=1 Tax=Micromonospora sp. WMMD1274 TaxID=3404116 RepID=UPI003B947303